jgi:hypothetical protein
VPVAYLSIPEITDDEELLSYSAGQPNEYNVIIRNGTVGVHLFQMAVSGTVIPLVVIADSLMIALDDVYVSNATTTNAGGGEAIALTFTAGATRYF